MERLTRILMSQFKAAINSNHPNLSIVYDENDINTWYFRISDLPEPYRGGEYIFCLKAPNDFPIKPPEFTFLTPNGVFETTGKICISIGEFHSDDHHLASKTGSYGWRPVLGMMGFAREVVNGLLDPEHLGEGIRICNASIEVKKKYAINSCAFNSNTYQSLVAQFQKFERDYPESEVVRRIRMCRNTMMALKMRPVPENLNAYASLLSCSLGDMWRIINESYSELTKYYDCFGYDEIDLFIDEFHRVLRSYNDNIKYHLLLSFDIYLRQKLHLDWSDRFNQLIQSLPNVCGSSCYLELPHFVESKRELFAKYYLDIANFLSEDDIDAKAIKGKELMWSHRH